jgi:hypothetical protein
LTRRRTNVIFATVLLGMLLSALYQTIVSTALPTIVGDLGGGSHLTWVVSAYLLADTIATVLAAKFGDLFGRKLVFQVSAAASCSPRRPAGCPELERINERWPTIDETENAVVVLEVRTIPDVPSAPWSTPSVAGRTSSAPEDVGSSSPVSTTDWPRRSAGPAWPIGSAPRTSFRRRPCCSPPSTTRTRREPPG